MPRTMKNINEVKGHRTASEKANRQAAQAKMFSYPKLSLTAPTWLNDEAAAEWRRLVPLLDGHIPVSQLDTSLLATYCQTYATIQECQQHIETDGLVVETQAGATKPNPYVTIQTAAKKDLIKMASELGLSVYGRLHLNIEREQHGTVEDDPLRNLVSG